MEIIEFFEKKFNELKIKKIEENEILRDSKSVYYKDIQVEIIYFNPYKITNKTRLFNYLKYMMEVKNQYTIKNIVGYSVLSEMYYLIFEKINDEKTLSQASNKLNFIGKLTILVQLIEILDYFHNVLQISLKILSTNNVFVMGKSLKINVCNPKRIVQECSSDNFKKEDLYFEYLPPDLFDLENNEVDGEIEYTKEGNIWSFGCIISEVFSGIVPWNNNKYCRNAIIIIKLLINKRPFPIPESILSLHESINNLIKDCTNLNPNLRPKINNIGKILKTLVQNKDNIYTVLLIFKTNEKFKEIKKKYIISFLHKYM